MKLSKLFQKTLLAMFALFGVISISSSILAAWILYDHMTQEYVSKGRAIARSIVNSSVEVLLNRDASTVQSMIDQYLEMNGVAYVFVQDGDGRIISHTFVPAVPDVAQTLPRDPHGMLVTKVIMPGQHAVIDVAKPILAGVAGYVHVGMDQELIHSYIVSAVLQMQALLFFIFWGSVILLYLVIKKISQPLTELTEYANRLSDHDFSADIHIESKDEVGLLGKTMQSMSRELSGLITGLENAVTNATLELHDHLDYTTAIIDNMADGLLVVDVRGRVTRVNPTLAEFFDFEGARLTGKDVSILFSADVHDLTRQALACPHEVCSTEVAMSRARIGKAVATTIHRSSDLDESGPAENNCLGVVVLIRDVTKEKQIDVMKTEFISTVSHELRTPLTSVLGFAKIIDKKFHTSIIPKLDMSQKKTVRAVEQIHGNMDVIINEGQRLTELINDVLDISKMESGRTEWRYEQVDMGEIIKNSAASAEGLIDEKGLELIIDVPNDVPTITGDKNRLMQVMINLFSNAVKFTSAGTISCSAWEQHNAILVSVSDTGAGIASEDQEAVFERFRQAGDTMTEKPKGTGLGLPICKQIIEHHQGQIWVESQLGEGSTFFFTIPLQPMEKKACDASAVAPPAPAKEGKPAAVPHKRSDEILVMVVDDDPNVRSYLEQVLQHEGYRTVAAEDGFMALELARRTLPDCITMDLMMPGMDGNSVIARLRENKTTSHIPVVVVSAFTEWDHGGGDATLSKPVDEERLVETINGLLQSGKYLVECCLVISGQQIIKEHRLFRICASAPKLCQPEELKDYLKQGFSGAVFIASDMAESVDLAQISKYKNVVVIIVSA